MLSAKREFVVCSLPDSAVLHPGYGETCPKPLVLSKHFDFAYRATRSANGVCGLLAKAEDAFPVAVIPGLTAPSRFREEGSCRHLLRCRGHELPACQDDACWGENRSGEGRT
jgi:hypothetical protein